VHRTSSRIQAPGLDGLRELRGLAVLAVVGFHERFSGLPGGFLGVDVFFVISGYLITDLLAAPRDLGGRLDLRGFWIKRARRLLPRLTVLLAAVTAAVAVFEPDQMPTLRPALLTAWAADGEPLTAGPRGSPALPPGSRPSTRPLDKLGL
jgi:peptidoglycan/LPS O-acetylase OafA/YrhL